METIKSEAAIKIQSKFGRIWVTMAEFKRCLPAILRETPIGFFVGVLPGAGGMPARAADPAERFAQMDADHDGNLTWEELSAARPNLNRNAFDTIDANRDGHICLDEWKAFSAGHGGSVNMPDMSGMMKAMRGAGDNGASAQGMPLVMPPSQANDAPAGSAMPLITPPAAGK